MRQFSSHGAASAQPPPPAAERRSLSPLHSQPRSRWALFSRLFACGGARDRGGRGEEGGQPSVYEALREAVAQWSEGSSRCFCFGLHVVPTDVVVLGFLLLLILLHVSLFLAFWVGAILKADRNLLDKGLDASSKPKMQTPGSTVEPLDPVAAEFRDAVIPYTYAAFLTLATAMPVFVIAVIYFLFYRGLAATTLSRRLHSAVPVIHVGAQPNSCSAACSGATRQDTNGGGQRDPGGRRGSVGRRPLDGEGAQDCSECGEIPGRGRQAGGRARGGDADGPAETPMSAEEREALQQEARELPLQALVYMIYGFGFTVSLVWMVCSHIPRALCRKCAAPTTGQQWVEWGCLLVFAIMWTVAYFICPSRHDIEKRHQTARRMRERLAAYRSLASLETATPSSSLLGLGPRAASYTPSVRNGASTDTYRASPSHSVFLPVHDSARSGGLAYEGWKARGASSFSPEPKRVGSVREATDGDTADDDELALAFPSAGGGAKPRAFSIPYPSPLVPGGLYDDRRASANGERRDQNCRDGSIELQGNARERRTDGVHDGGSASDRQCILAANGRDGDSVRVIGRQALDSRTLFDGNRGGVSGHNGAASSHPRANGSPRPCAAHDARDASRSLPIVGRDEKDAKH
ncbi:hypothetical protein BESB_005760 [Besnoitia besnoiti]|uniref:Transmembrane protein n=1 Tax=Besnoitia besnoiti TaxID=94643 RepID=A0A2A9MJU0_BESBE|nr:hypothetical protein BESB_005760 [Besnoitia besnoiti]PFH38235.1 hypothetical protein BESB_005760 [Besnoitia besnoiti]